MFKKLSALCIAAVILLATACSIHAATQDKTKVPVLLYHHFYTQEQAERFKGNDAAMPIEEFAEQMKYLHDSGYKTISLKDLQDFIQGKKALPPKSVVIVMDDGYESNYTLAYPILKKYGYTAAVFVIAGSIKNSPYCTRPVSTPHMTTDEMRKAEDAFTYGSHTYNMHSAQNGIPYLLAKSDSDVMADLLASRWILNETPYFAYPYGAYNEHLINLLKRAGFTMAFTTKQGYVVQGANPYALLRFPVLPGTNIEQFKKIVEGRD